MFSPKGVSACQIQGQKSRVFRSLQAFEKQFAGNPPPAKASIFKPLRHTRDLRASRPTVAVALFPAHTDLGACSSLAVRHARKPASACGGVLRRAAKLRGSPALRSLAFSQACRECRAAIHFFHHFFYFFKASCLTP